MHIYIYDAFLQDKKFDSTVAKIETRVTDLGLNGKIIRLGVMKSVAAAIGDEIKKGAKTIIAVGDERILNQAVNAIARFYLENPSYNQVPLGFIPVGRNTQELASFLGYSINENACDTISARRIKTFDLGQVNNNFFLFHTTIPTDRTKVEIDEEYSIEISERGEVLVVNLPFGIDLPPEISADPSDNKLELFIRTQSKGRFLPLKSGANKQSVFSFQNLNILNPEKPLTLDSAIEVTAPAEIKIAPIKLEMIVGKNRGF